MPSISKQKFLRIQASHDPWRVGLKRSFGSNLNEMTKNWRRSSNASRNPQTNTTRYANEYLVNVMNSLDLSLKKNQRHADVAGMLNCLKVQHNAISDALIALREIIFEQVRREHFVDLPSRQTCLYLCPDRPECICYWWKELTTQGHDPGKKTFEVEAEGDTFVAPAEMLVLQSMSVDEWEALAHRYWSPHEAGSASDEILFVGEIEIVAERFKSEFGFI